MPGDPAAVHGRYNLLKTAFLHHCSSTRVSNRDYALSEVRRKSMLPIEAIDDLHSFFRIVSDCE
jgi:hypothetical protein